MSENAEFIHRNGIIIDKSYVEWLSEVKARFQRRQYLCLGLSAIFARQGSTANQSKRMDCRIRRK